MIDCSTWGEPGNLDKTYFPFGMDYEWTYQYRYSGHNWDYGEEWDIYDTITVRVIDSLYGDAGWLFLLEGSFMDLKSPVEINGNEIEVFGEMIKLKPKENDSEGWYELGISYADDTLILTYIIEPYTNSCNTREVRRLIGIGAVRQYDSYWEGEYYSDAMEYTLLYFSKGGDTVWRKD